MKVRESISTIKQFQTLYHGCRYKELIAGNRVYDCFYVTPVFAYAVFYSTGSNSKHGCVFEMKPTRDLNIFDARDEGALEELKTAVEKLNPENTLVRRINWEDLKTKDWSTVCFRSDETRDNLLLKTVKALGYDGFINHEWDTEAAMYYARGQGGLGMVTDSISIGIFDASLLEITDKKVFNDYFEDELFCKCHQADEDIFIVFLQDEGFDDFYYEDAEDAKHWASKNLLYLDASEVDNLVEKYLPDYEE